MVFRFRGRYPAQQLLTGLPQYVSQRFFRTGPASGRVIGSVNDKHHADPHLHREGKKGLTGDGGRNRSRGIGACVEGFALIEAP